MVVGGMILCWSLSYDIRPLIRRSATSEFNVLDYGSPAAYQLAKISSRYSSDDCWETCYLNYGWKFHPTYHRSLEMFSWREVADDLGLSVGAAAGLTFI